MVALIVSAWLALWGWGISPYGRFLNHQYLDQIQGSPVLLLTFVAGWVLMLVAMMLPTSLPLVLTFETMVRGRADHRRLVVLLLAGYLSVWTLFGVFVHAADAGVHASVAQSSWLQVHAWGIAAAILFLAGLYQFVPLKYVCVEKCRSPLMFILGYWRGRHDQGQAFRLGVFHGLFCVGCCWALMLVMFAVGVGSLGWMLALSAVMAVEKNVAAGRLLSAPLGLALVGCGLAVTLAAVRS